MYTLISLGAVQSVSMPEEVSWRLGVLVQSDTSPALESSPMQLVRVTEREAPSLPYCLAVCRQTSLGTFRFSNEYASVQNVGDNVTSVDATKLHFPTVVKLAAVDHAPNPLAPVQVEEVHIGLVHPRRPDILLTSASLIHSLNCFDREPVWYRPSTTPTELERVVIGVEFGENREEAWRVVSRLYQLSKAGPLILQQDFDFTIGFDTGSKVQVNILETSPTMQGVVSDRTTISVLHNVPSSLEYLDSYEERPRAQSASNFDLEGPPVKGDYIIDAITIKNFPLQNHFVLLPTETAHQYNIQHCQSIWVSPASSPLRGGVSRRKQSVIPLDVGDDSCVAHMHMAIALLYEDTEQLEKYLPPRSFGQRHLFASLRLAYIHPELLYFLFPETISPSRSFRISVKVRPTVA